ncbi:MAG: DUF4920 domain-containing protein [Myxococcota bacterium]
MPKRALDLSAGWTLLGVLAFMGSVTTTACNRDQAAKGTAPAGAPALASAPGTDAEVVDSCPHGEDHACGSAEDRRAATATSSSGPQHFGRAFELDVTQDLAAVASTVGTEPQRVQVRGKVDRVCQMKGCWMVLRDGDAEVRVVTYSGKFLLPTDTQKGREAIVEGRLEPKIVTQKYARHLAVDGGEDPNEIRGDQRELHLYASAVALK